MEDLDVGGRKVVKCVLKKYDVNVWTGFRWLTLHRRVLVNTVVKLLEQ